LVKRLLVTGTLVCLLATLAVAAPALSLRPYRPDPVQFSMAAPSKAARVAGVSRTIVRTSPAIRTPKRFNMVGLTWRGGPREPAIHVRTHKQGERWSRWVRLDAHAEDGPDPRSAESEVRGTTAPTWAGEADYIQYRSYRALPRLRLHFINVRGTATRTDRVRTSLRRVVNTAALTVGGIARTPPADAADSQPPMVSRSGWGGEQCTPRAKPDMGEVEAAFIHHTASANDYTRTEAPDVVLGICLFHRNTNGWNDIGYNFLVDRFGRLYEGRAGGTDQPVIGAQAQGYNAQTTGIANLGTYSQVRQSGAALRAIASLIRWKLPLHGAPTSGPVTLTSAGGPTNRFPAGRSVRLQRVIGHRDTGATACPGEALYAQRPALRRLVGSLRPDENRAVLTAGPTGGRLSVRYGSSARVQGTLRRGDGPALASLPLTIDARVGRRWRLLATPTTTADGGFAARVKLDRSRMLRVRFPGSGPFRAVGERFTVGVKPRLRIFRPATAAAVGGRVPISGRVSPHKRQVFQVLAQRRGGRYVTVGTKRLRVSRRGQFRGSFIPAGRARYRYHVVARADENTARGRSEMYVVEVARQRGGGVRAP